MTDVNDLVNLKIYFGNQMTIDCVTKRGMARLIKGGHNQYLSYVGYEGESELYLNHGSTQLIVIKPYHSTHEKLTERIQEELQTHDIAVVSIGEGGN